MTDFSNLSVTTTHKVPWELQAETLVSRIKSKICSLEKEQKWLAKNNMINSETYYLSEKTMKACSDILNIKIEDEDDYKFVHWLYNNANFRTESELTNKIEEIKQEEARKIRSTPEYNKHFHPFLIYIKWLFLLPTIFTFIFCTSQAGRPYFNGGDLFVLISYGGWFWFIMPFIFTYFYIKRHDKKFAVPSDPALIGAITAATAAGIVAYKVTGNKKQDSSPPKEI